MASARCRALVRRPAGRATCSIDLVHFAPIDKSGGVPYPSPTRKSHEPGFFRIRGLTIAAEPLQMEIHVPYWVGFFGSRARLKVVVLDAVRRQIEGGKATRLVEQWLQANAA